MRDDPNSIPIGTHDVIAAWLVCLAVAGAFVIYPSVAAGIADPAGQAQAAPRTMPAAICAARSAPGDLPRS